MFVWNNDITDITVEFPAALTSIVNVRNRNDNGYTISNETGTVPPIADGEGKYRLSLDLVPLEQPGVIIEVDPGGGFEARDNVPYGETVGVGQVGIEMETGLLEFNVADANKVVRASYTGHGSAVMAYLANKVQAELRAVQIETRKDCYRWTGKPVVASDGNAAWPIRPAVTYGTWQPVGIELFCRTIGGVFAPTGTTTVRLAVAHGAPPVNYLEASLAISERSSGLVETWNGTPFTRNTSQEALLWVSSAGGHVDPVARIFWKRTA